MSAWKRNWRPWAPRFGEYRNRIAALGLSFALLAGTLFANAPLDRFVDSSRSSLDLRLPNLGNSATKEALLRACQRGVKVRLLLDRDFLANRRQAAALRQLGAQLRWQRNGTAIFVVVDARLCMAGPSLKNGSPQGARAEELDRLKAFAPKLEADFEREWKRSSEALPRQLQLEDELEALPDPREKEPRLKTERRTSK